MSHPATKLCNEYFEDKVFSCLGEDCWVAGGAVRDWWLHRRVTSDVDVWFACEAHLLSAKEKADKTWKLIKETPASINYKNGGMWVQLIKKHYFPSMKTTVDAFDFTVCCAATNGKEFIHHDHFFIDLTMKRLAFNAIPYPVSTWKRCSKYMERGFKLCPDEQNKLLSAMKKELETFTIEEANERYME